MLIEIDGVRILTDPVWGDGPVASHVLGALRDDFDDSDLPFKVDLVDWATTNPGFRKIIECDGVPVQNP